MSHQCWWIANRDPHVEFGFYGLSADLELQRQLLGHAHEETLNRRADPGNCRGALHSDPRFILDG